MRELVVPALLLAYLVAYVVQVRGLPIASTLYPYLISGGIALGVVFVLGQHARAARAEATGAAAGSVSGTAAAAGEDASGEAFRRSARATRVLDANALRALRLPVLFLVACALYPAALGAFGFALSTIVFVALLLRAFGRESWFRATLVALGMTVLFFLFVDRLLGVPLPRFSYAVLPLGL